MFTWRRRRRAAQTREPTLPGLLPQKRPRSLTPTPTKRRFSRRSNKPVQSDFFKKLPAEVRRMIMIAAFGGQVIHMDLIYDHPNLPCPEGPDDDPPDDQAHCNFYMDWDFRAWPHRQGDYTHWPPLMVDKSMPKRWMWRSSVCHRNPPYPLPDNYQAPTRIVHFAKDECRFGRTSDERDFCQEYSGEFPEKCFIGAMGWLLTCRQAYVEGIDVMYSTNTIHSASKEMLMHIDQLLLPQRLASINSVELIWEFDPFPRPYGVPTDIDNDEDFRTYPWPPENEYRGPMSNMRSFRTFLDALPSMFPSAQFLRISLQGLLRPIVSHNTHGYAHDIRLETTENAIMKPVDDMVRRIGPSVRELSVAVPSSMYMPRRNQAKKDGQTVDHICHGAKIERHWRKLKRSSNLPGYWVELGQINYGLPSPSGTASTRLGWVPLEDRCMYLV